MKTIKKTTISKFGVKVDFEYLEPLDLREAIEVLGEKKVMDCIRYSLSVTYRKKAIRPKPIPKGLRTLYRKNPEVVEKLLEEGREEK